jgi:hypothetical protein
VTGLIIKSAVRVCTLGPTNVNMMENGLIIICMVGGSTLGRTADRLKDCMKMINETVMGCTYGGMDVNTPEIGSMESSMVKEVLFLKMAILGKGYGMTVNDSNGLTKTARAIIQVQIVKEIFTKYENLLN